MLLLLLATALPAACSDGGSDRGAAEGSGGGGADAVVRGGDVTYALEAETSGAGASPRPSSRSAG
ncbi:MAG: hypothetical protein R2716_10900 [Microthrixaceae bacterium]